MHGSHPLKPPRLDLHEMQNGLATPPQSGKMRFEVPMRVAALRFFLVHVTALLQPLPERLGA